MKQIVHVQEGWSCMISTCTMHICQYNLGPLDYVRNTTKYSSVTLRKSEDNLRNVRCKRTSGSRGRLCAQTSRILLQASKCRSQIIVGLVRKMGHQLVHLKTFLWRVLIAHLKGFVTCCSVVQRLDAHICHICATDALSNAVALQLHKL